MEFARRLVIDRDGRRCVVCGIGSGEPYPEDGCVARLTAGHRTAGARMDDVSPDNLQAECARCNEPVRDTPSDPETLAAVGAAVSHLNAKQKGRLREWLEVGHRTRDELDATYDRVRRLTPDERTELLRRLRPSRSEA